MNHQVTIESHLEVSLTRSGELANNLFSAGETIKNLSQAGTFASSSN